VDPGDEPVEVVDDDGCILDVVPRRVMRRHRLLHRCTYVLVVNDDGDPYVHRRTDTKDEYPGFLDVTAGGVCAVGEAYDDGAARELERSRASRSDRRSGSGTGATATTGTSWAPCTTSCGTAGSGGNRPRSRGAFEPLHRIEERTGAERFCPDGVEVYRRWRHDRALWRSEGSG